MRIKIVIIITLVAFAICLIIAIISAGISRWQSENALVLLNYDLHEVVETKILDSLKAPKKDAVWSSFDKLLQEGDWNEIPSSEWGTLIDASDYWFVKYTDEVLVTDNIPQSVNGIRFDTYDVSDGFFLIVQDREFSGSLYFYSEEQGNEKYKIFDGFVDSIFARDNKYFALANYLRERSFNSAILEIYKSSGKWRYKPILIFTGSPFCCVNIDEDTMYVVTNSKLLKIMNNKIVDKVIENAVWQGLGPNSITYDGEYLYIGMIAGIAKVNTDNYHYKIYSPVRH